MNNNSSPLLARMSALTETTRTRMLRLLEMQELTVAELCAVVQLPQSTVSRHLKVLAASGWVEARRRGTSHLYHMPLDLLGRSTLSLWTLVRKELDDEPVARHDDERLQRVLAERQTRSQAFFASAAGQWDKLRDELFGRRFDLMALPGLLDAAWKVADLGCGTGQVAEALAPFVDLVIAVDSSSSMLKAARKRLEAAPNVELRRGQLESLPIETDELDAAVCMLVLHHLSRPQAAINEIARVLHPGGRVLIVDMVEHDRREYEQQMGHVWLGFAVDRMHGWLEEAGFTRVTIGKLPADPRGKGPGLFAASGVAMRSTRDRNGTTTKVNAHDLATIEKHDKKQ